MTTSEPQAGRRDDDVRENRSIGQRIRDAVLGDDDPRRDAPETRYADPARDSTATGVAHDDTTRGDTVRDGSLGDGSLRDEVRDSSLHNDTTRDDSLRDEVRDSNLRDDTRDGSLRNDTVRDDTVRDDTVRDDSLRDDTVRDRDVRDDTVRGDSGSEYAGYEQAMREHVEEGAVPDPVRDDVAQDGTRRDVTDRGAAAGTGAGYGSMASDDRDAVTTSHDPDRDADYDPPAAGAALGDPPARSTSDDAGAREYDTRDYEPATDTAYVDEGRTDLGRGTDRTDSGRSAGGAAAGAAAGAAVASAGHHTRDDDRAGFSEVDDTSAVEPDTTPRATADTSTADTSTAATSAASGGTADRTVSDGAGGSTDSDGTDSEGRERLVPAERAEEYSSRWDALKGDFVDEPRRAVTQADDLVGELLDEIQRMFTKQRSELEQGFDHDRASTEDLRLALRRYRSFFERLLSF